VFPNPNPAILEAAEEKRNLDPPLCWYIGFYAFGAIKFEKDF